MDWLILLLPVAAFLVPVVLLNALGRRRSASGRPRRRDDGGAYAGDGSHDHRDAGSDSGGDSGGGDGGGGGD